MVEFEDIDMILVLIVVEFFGVPFHLCGDEAFDSHRSTASFQTAAEDDCAVGTPADHHPTIKFDVADFDDRHSLSLRLSSQGTQTTVCYLTIKTLNDWFYNKKGSGESYPSGLSL